MSSGTHNDEALTAYALGLLNETEGVGLEQHLTECELRRMDYADLRETVAQLAELPPEIFLDGAPEDSDLVLQRALRQIRHEASAPRRYPRIVAAAVAVPLAAAIGANMLSNFRAPTAVPGALSGDSPGVSHSAPDSTVPVPVAFSAPPPVDSLPGGVRALRSRFGERGSAHELGRAAPHSLGLHGGR